MTKTHDIQMKQFNIVIEGLPEGWEAVAFRNPRVGEHCLHRGQVIPTAIEVDCDFLIVQKSKPRQEKWLRRLEKIIRLAKNYCITNKHF